MANSQVELLKYDISECHRLIDGNPTMFDPLGETDDLPRINRLWVVADLFWRIVDYAAGTAAVAPTGRSASLYVLQRGILESYVNLAYLHAHKQRDDEAWVFTAFSLVKQAALFGTEPDLEGVPEAACLRARLLIKGKNSWSGKPFRQMLEDLNLDLLHMYSWLSEHGHARFLGHHARLSARDEATGEIVYGVGLGPQDVEILANFARLLLLSAFAMLWLDFTGTKATFASEDPDQWRSEQGLNRE